LDCLPSGSFEEIVEAGDHDQALSVGCQSKAKVTEVCADDMLNLWQLWRGVNSDQWTALVEAVEHIGDCGCVGRLSESKVDGRQDAARYGQ